MQYRNLGIDAMAGSPFLLLKMTPLSNDQLWSAYVQVTSGFLFTIAMTCTVVGMLQWQRIIPNYVKTYILIPLFITLVLTNLVQLIEVKWQGSRQFPFSEICQAMSTGFLILLCSQLRSIGIFNKWKRYIFSAAILWLTLEIADRVFIGQPILLSEQYICSSVICFLLGYVLAGAEDQQIENENKLYELSSL